MDDFPSDDAEEPFRALDDDAAAELDAVSEQLFAAAVAMQSITTMSEPVRADAIAIARDILRLLKVTFGEVTTLTGLNLKSREEGLALGGLTAVGTIYSQLLAWARGIDGSIMSDPSVLAAIDAFGVIGYMAKREALRIARTSKDMFLATSLAQQLDTIGGKYLNPQEKNVGKLLERIEHGIDRVLSRVQDLTISGAGVSQSKNDLGGGMSNTPVAGQSMQQGADGNKNRDAVGKRNAEAMMAEEAAAQAEAARIAAQNAAKAKKENRPAPARPAPGAARQNTQTVRAQAQSQRNSASNAAVTGTAAANATAAQMQNRVNNARMANIHNQHAHEEDDHHQQEQQALQRQLAAARDAARKAASKATAAAAQKQQTKPAINADMLKGFKGFDMSGMKPVPETTKPQVSSQTVNPSNGLKPPPTPPVAPAIDPITNQPIPGKGIGR